MRTAPFKLLVKHVAASRPPQTRTFAQDRISIGRAPGNDIALTTPMRLVSRYHAEVRRHAGAWWLIDLGSKNTTTLNGQPLQAGPLYRLRPGDCFQVGDFRLELVTLEAQQAAPRTGTVQALAGVG